MLKNNMRLFTKFIIGILILNAGCNQHSTVLNIRQDKFENWLKQYSLTRSSFRDSIPQRTFELWAYQVPLENVPKPYIKIPSIDSSYFLITNFDKKKATTYSESLFFEFLEEESKDVYIGIEILEGKSKDILDYFWSDKSTMYILDKDSLGIFTLTKLKMQIDSMWYYKTQK
jgi:hypothetical protein